MKNRKLKPDVTLTLPRASWITILRALDNATRSPVPDDYKGAHEVALWAMEKGSYAELRKELIKKIASEDVKRGGR